MAEDAARAYVRRIRNTKKRLYAIAYLGFLLGKREKPNDDDYRLSEMGKQAVWMNLRELLQRQP
jgi:hypothetical protein